MDLNVTINHRDFHYNYNVVYFQYSYKPSEPNNEIINGNLHGKKYNIKINEGAYIFDINSMYDIIPNNDIKSSWNYGIDNTLPNDQLFNKL